MSAWPFRLLINLESQQTIPCKYIKKKNLLGIKPDTDSGAQQKKKNARMDDLISKDIHISICIVLFVHTS